MVTIKEKSLIKISRTPILITSSITPQDTSVKLSDPQERLFHAIESIENWIRVAPGAPLVICDGSNFDFRPIVSERFPGASIECLFFQNDCSKIRTYGRGYGEGEIIKFALMHSAHLRDSDAFSKCSSKLWVENYSECLRELHGDCLFSGVFKNAFSPTKQIEMVQVDTRFYIVKSGFYLSRLIDAHRKIGVTPGFGLEDSFYSSLTAMGKKMYLFSIPPVIRGVGGGTAEYYKSTWQRIIKEKIRLRIIKRSHNFKNLFDL